MFPRIHLRLTVLLFLRLELRSLGKISEGEELTVAYVDFLNLSEERKRMLKSQYFFDCTCDHCMNCFKDDLKLAGREVDGVKVCFCPGFNVPSSYIRQEGPNTVTVFIVTWKIRTGRKHEPLCLF